LWYLHGKHNLSAIPLFESFGSSREQKRRTRHSPHPNITLHQLILLRQPLRPPHKLQLAQRPDILIIQLLDPDIRRNRLAHKLFHRCIAQQLQHLAFISPSGSDVARSKGIEGLEDRRGRVRRREKSRVGGRRGGDGGC